MHSKNIGDLQIWIHNRRRSAKTEEETQGWVKLDAWLQRRIDVLREKRFLCIHEMPVYALIEDEEKL